MREEKADYTTMFLFSSVLHLVAKFIGQLNDLAANQSELCSEYELELNSPPKNMVHKLGPRGVASAT